ncbi:MAG: AI-2E family transporter [Bacteroidota bacterium]
MNGERKPIDDAPAADGSAAAPDVRLLASRIGVRMYRVVGLIFLLALIFFYFDAISRVLLLAFVATIIGIAFNALVSRLPVNRKIGTAIVALITFAVIGIVTYLSGAAVAAQVRAFVGDLPQILAAAEEWVDGVMNRLGIEVELTGPRVQQMMNSLMGEVTGGTLIAGTFGVLEIVAIGLLVLMGAFFVVANPNRQLLTPLMRAVPKDQRPAYRRMFKLMGERLSGWLIGTLVSMIVIGILSAVVFTLLGIPYALLLGLLNGIQNIIPLIGAWIGGLIAVIVTLFANPSMLLWVILAVIAIQELEGNIVRPVVMSGTARVHPFVTLLSLLLFSSMFGLLGAILSIPITLAIITMVEVMWVENTLQSQDDEIEPVVKG